MERKWTSGWNLVSLQCCWSNWRFCGCLFRMFCLVSLNFPSSSWSFDIFHSQQIECHLREIAARPQASSSNQQRYVFPGVHPIGMSAQTSFRIASSSRSAVRRIERSTCGCRFFFCIKTFRREKNVFVHRRMRREGGAWWITKARTPQQTACSLLTPLCWLFHQKMRCCGNSAGRCCQRLVHGGSLALFVFRRSFQFLPKVRSVEQCFAPSTKKPKQSNKWIILGVYLRLSIFDLVAADACMILIWSLTKFKLVSCSRIIFGLPRQLLVQFITWISQIDQKISQWQKLFCMCCSLDPRK